MITIPPQDLATLQGIKKPVRDEINAWLPVVNRAGALATVIGARAAFIEVGKEYGLPVGTVKSKYYAAKEKGWRGLVNGRLLGSGTRKVPSLLIPHWHGLVLANQRNTAKAWDRLVAEYRGGKVIPGMPAPAERSSSAMPRGITLRNLRRYKLPEASVVMARQGIAAARAHLPHGPQDISHIRPLEYIVFDDVELDFLIIVPECPTPVKVRLLVAMDLCSRVILGYGVRPAITREDGREDGLKLRDMKALVARFLRAWGVPAEYPMHFIVERATAALPDATKTALAEISDGQIVVHDTSMVVGQVFEFRDKASGNSWGKAWLESNFNSLHNELQDVPGQKGRRYDLAPAELDGRRKELAALVRAGKKLPIELRYQFRFPFKSGTEALQELDAALARLHRRTDHQLLCFDKMALWRVPSGLSSASGGDTWKPEAELPEWMLGNVEKLEWMTRLESPLERFERLLPLAGERMRVPDCGLQLLMDEHKEVVFRDLQFAFERQRTDYVYLPPDAMLPLLTEGKTYLLWFHPDHMETVYVTRDRPHLGYLGSLKHFTAGRRGDLEDAKAYLREKQRLFAHAQSAAQQTRIGKLHERAEDLAENTEIIQRGLKSIETEVEVVPSGLSSAVREVSSTRSSSGPIETGAAGVRAMTADRNEATRAREAVEAVDIVKETLARPRKEKADAADQWL